MLLPRLAHVVKRYDHAEVELLRPAGVDELDSPTARHEAPDLLQRALGRRKADALDGLARQPVEALDRERQVRPALRPGHRVHLVEHERLDRLQHLARARGQEEVERFRGRDQDVRMVAEHRGAVALRRVTGADGDAELRVEPGERPAEVPLDVVVQRLERRDVEEPQAIAR